ncbi:MAG: hypothetical protein ABIH00_00205 [Armatimonadota bacterium]
MSGRIPNNVNLTTQTKTTGNSQHGYYEFFEELIKDWMWSGLQINVFSHANHYLATQKSQLARYTNVNVVYYNFSTWLSDPTVAGYLEHLLETHFNVGISNFQGSTNSSSSPQRQAFCRYLSNQRNASSVYYRLRNYIIKIFYIKAYFANRGNKGLTDAVIHREVMNKLPEILDKNEVFDPAKDISMEASKIVNAEKQVKKSVRLMVKSFIQLQKKNPTLTFKELIEILRYEFPELPDIIATSQTWFLDPLKKVYNCSKHNYGRMTPLIDNAVNKILHPKWYKQYLLDTELQGGILSLTYKMRLENWKPVKSLPKPKSKKVKARARKKGHAYRAKNDPLNKARKALTRKLPFKPKALPPKPGKVPKIKPPKPNTGIIQKFLRAIKKIIP